MKFFKPIAEEKSRRIFLVFFILSCLFPLLIMIFICNQYLQPFIEADKSSLLGEILTYGFLVMLFFPLLSFLLMFRRIRALEGLTREIRAKSAEVIEGKKGFGDQTIETREIFHIPAGGDTGATGEENEIQSLIRSFNNIFQTAADQLSEREHMKELLASLIALASDLTAELEPSRLFPLIISRVTEVMAVERTSLYVTRLPSPSARGSAAGWPKRGRSSMWSTPGNSPISTAPSI
jgi:hypothetical protein